MGIGLGLGVAPNYQTCRLTLTHNVYAAYTVMTYNMNNMSLDAVFLNNLRKYDMFVLDDVIRLFPHCITTKLIGQLNSHTVLF